MLREALLKHKIGFNKEFRFRGEEPGRLENFSDAAFALAITLLLISTSPPTNFDQIKKFAWEIIPFSFCIALIILIWHQHFTFFYRYGLRNPKVMFLNAIFLVIVLYYVYPLKYLTKAILIPISELFNQDTLKADLKTMYSGVNMADLMIIYGIGATLIFITLTFMYRYALTKAQDLQLNDIEKFDTKASIHVNLLMASIPFLSVLVTLLFYNQKWGGLFAGLTYFLYPIATAIFWKLKNAKRSKLLSGINELSPPPQYPVTEDL